MFEDKILLWKLKKGNADVLAQIYHKYKDNMLGLAISLCQDKSLAEDVVHDTFVSFAEIAGQLHLRSSLKSYLSTCVANKLRKIYSSKHSQTEPMDNIDMPDRKAITPDEKLAANEQKTCIHNALGQLHHSQREVIILHLSEGMRFKDIAKLDGVSINTVQSRYRYGLAKLKTLLESEVIL